METGSGSAGERQAVAKRRRCDPGGERGRQTRVALRGGAGSALVPAAAARTQAGCDSRVPGRATATAPRQGAGRTRPRRAAGLPRAKATGRARSGPGGDRSELGREKRAEKKNRASEAESSELPHVRTNRIPTGPARICARSYGWHAPSARARAARAAGVQPVRAPERSFKTNARFEPEAPGRRAENRRSSARGCRPQWDPVPGPTPDRGGKRRDPRS